MANRRHKKEHKAASSDSVAPQNCDVTAATAKLDESPESNRLYAVYADERKLLISGEHTQSNDLTKWLLTLSAGAFGVSLTVAKTVETAVVAESVNWLLWSWGAFGVTIVLTLISATLSIHAYRDYRRILDHGFQSESPCLDSIAKQQDQVRKVKWIRICDWIGVFAFVAGVLLLSTYVFLNQASIGGTHREQGAIAETGTRNSHSTASTLTTASQATTQPNTERAATDTTEKEVGE